MEPSAVKMICDETSSSGGSTSGVGPGDLTPAGYDIVGQPNLAEKTSILERIGRVNATRVMFNDPLSPH